MPGWRRGAYRAARPLLFAVDAERIHQLTLRALAVGAATTPGWALCRLTSGIRTPDRTPVELLGLTFRNRVGIGAGFDKDGIATIGWAALGLGFVEIGTVTPAPQAGNPRPRLARLAGDHALVNRMGFNNAGAPAVAARLATVRDRLPPGFVVGVNIGRGRDTDDAHAIDDYLSAARAVAPVADYVAVNVSSPNTPGLRALQDPGRLEPLLTALDAVEPRRPILVKLSPDLDAQQLDDAVRAVAASPARGVILSNTTTDRASLASPAPDWGGISGAPLCDRMLRAVERARKVAPTPFLIVASGGIADGAGAANARQAGADLVQLWTGLVYVGPGLIGEAVDACR
jgi:dihydroorotate dehydrogenase